MPKDDTPINDSTKKYKPSTAFKKGHEKVGGRKKGTKNKLTQKEKLQVEELCRRKGFNSVYWLINVVQNEEVPWRERIRAAIEINQCLFPKKKSMDVSVDQSITLIRQNLLKGEDASNFNTTQIPSAFLSKANLGSHGVGSKEISVGVAQESGERQDVSESDD